MKRIIVLLSLGLSGLSLYSQDTKPFNPPPEAHYFDFWEGSWVPLKEDGKVDSNAAMFKVTKSVHPAAWREEWVSLSSGPALRATAIRSWDKTNKRWMYVWVSENGLFQVWEGRKDGDHWYIYKEFDIDGDKYLSRQGWLLLESNRVLRISQKSYDQGKTWQLRFKTIYQKL